MTLFLNTSDIKRYVVINQQMHFDTLKPFINDAQEQYIVSLLGQSFYDSFIADYGVDAGVTGDNIQLLPYIQRPLANFAMYLAVDQISLNVGDGGIVQTRGDDDEPVPKWKFDNLKARYLSMAEIHAEKLLKYLESNATASKYPLWFSSSANTASQGLIISSASDATPYIDIDENRTIFKRIKKRSKKIEQTFIKKLIGAAQYDEIVTQLKDKSLSSDAENNELVAKLRPIICKKALFETIPTIRISISENGLTLYSSSDGVASRAAASKEDIKQLLWSLKDSDFGYESDIAELKQFIIDNITDYPLIEDSTAYTSRPTPGPRRPPVNFLSKKHFGV